MAVDVCSEVLHSLPTMNEDHTPAARLPNETDSVMKDSTFRFRAERPSSSSSSPAVSSTALFRSFRALVALAVTLAVLAQLQLSVRYRTHYQQIRYPVESPVLLRIAQEDLQGWVTSTGASPYDTAKHAKGAGSGPRRVFELPDPELFHKDCPECSIIHVSTETGIRYINSDRFDHLRLLWFGCSLRRIIKFLRESNVHLDTYVILNVADEWIESAKVPIWSKAKPNASLSSAKNVGVRDIMYPYEELLWSYEASLYRPFDEKKAAVVFRGSCTNDFRLWMVQQIRAAFGSRQANTFVSCEEDADVEPMSPVEQAEYRCLLDYDGHSYSRRTAWYLQTGSMVLRGGTIDDILSRLARSEEDTPVVFWKDDDMLDAVAACLQNDTYARQVAMNGRDFWRRYVAHGQAIWDGYMAHLLCESAKLWELRIDEEKWSGDSEKERQRLRISHKETEKQSPFRSKWQLLSNSCLICSLIADAATPTGSLGRLNTGFLSVAVGLGLVVFVAAYGMIIPLTLHVLQHWKSYYYAILTRGASSRLVAVSTTMHPKVR